MRHCDGLFTLSGKESTIIAITTQVEEFRGGAVIRQLVCMPE